MSERRNVVHRLNAVKSLLLKEATAKAKAVVRDPKVWQSLVRLLAALLVLLARMPSGPITALASLLMAVASAWAFPQKQTLGEGV
jgi:hypothetical protein